MTALSEMKGERSFCFGMAEKFATMVDILEMTICTGWFRYLETMLENKSQNKDK